MHDNWISNRQDIIQLKVIKMVPISRKSPKLVVIKKKSAKMYSYYNVRSSTLNDQFIYLGPKPKQYFFIFMLKTTFFIDI